MLIFLLVERSLVEICIARSDFKNRNNLELVIWVANPMLLDPYAVCPGLMKGVCEKASYKACRALSLSHSCAMPVHCFY